MGNPFSAQFWYISYDFLKIILCKSLLSTQECFKDTTVKLGDKERFDKEQIGVKEPFPVTNCQFTAKG